MKWIFNCARAMFAVKGMAVTIQNNYNIGMARCLIEDDAWQGEEPLRVALVTDFHASRGLWSGRLMAHMVKKEAVDLVCIVGDFFEPGVSYEEAMKFLAGVTTEVPVCYVTERAEEGEHHLEGLKNVMSYHYGVEVLDGRKVVYNIKNTKVNVYGLRDRLENQSKADWMDQAEMLLDDKAEGYRMLLCHRQERMVLSDRLEKNIVISGRTRKGQCPMIENQMLPAETFEECDGKKGKKFSLSALKKQKDCKEEQPETHITNRPGLVIVEVDRPDELL